VPASDREREATILRLRAAHLEGRIETDEFEERVGRAEGARTLAELEEAEADLPERSGPVQPTSGVPWFPGRVDLRALDSGRADQRPLSGPRRSPHARPGPRRRAPRRPASLCTPGL